MLGMAWNDPNWGHSIFRATMGTRSMSRLLHVFVWVQRYMFLQQHDVCLSLCDVAVYSDRFSMKRRQLVLHLVLTM